MTDRFKEEKVLGKDIISVKDLLGFNRVKELVNPKLVSLPRCLELALKEDFYTQEDYLTFRAPKYYWGFSKVISITNVTNSLGYKFYVDPSVDPVIKLKKESLEPLEIHGYIGDEVYEVFSVYDLYLEWKENDLWGSKDPQYYFRFFEPSNSIFQGTPLSPSCPSVTFSSLEEAKKFCLIEHLKEDLEENLECM